MFRLAPRDVPTKGLTEHPSSMPLYRLPTNFRYSGGSDVYAFRLAPILMHDPEVVERISHSLAFLLAFPAIG